MDVVFRSTTARRNALFWFYPEFPEKPYLSISATERSRRMRIAWPSDQQAARAAMMDPGILPQFLGDDLQAGVRKLGRPSILYGSSELALIKIDWIYSNDWLLKTFAAWLSESRPPNVEVSESRGAGNFIRQRRCDLKLLGAWRLLKANAMPWNDAFIQTAFIETSTRAGRDTFKHVGKVSRNGEPLGLYGNRKEPWERAAKQAEELIRQLNEHAKSP
jgi:hypothetical protein